MITNTADASVLDRFIARKQIDLNILERTAGDIAN